MKFLDLFAGIGGFRLGMERAGHECVGFCEIDPFARKSYKAIHDTKGEFEFHDITRVTDESVRGIGRVDVICGGFPCQAFSIAGKRAGFEDTRGTLFFEIARFASILRPKYLFLENVTGLLNHDNGNTFETILGALDELGYDAEWQVFNSKNFGVPQNRERVFIIGHLRGAGGRAIFPFGGDDTAVDTKQSKINKVGNIRKMGRSQSGDVVSVDSLAPTLCSTTTQKDPLKVLIAGQLPGKFEMPNRVYAPEGIAPTIRTMQGGGLEPKIIQRGHGYNQGGEHDTAPTLTSNSWQENNLLAIKEATAKGYAEATVGDSVNLSHPNSVTRRGRVEKQVANTLLTGEEQGVITPNFRIRKLTPRECRRLQGFPDWAFDKAQAVNSNSQLYKQAGNSVTVNVIEAIARKLE
ncbi:DNA cytosine methyltransferase [Streptococcus suis]|uniref:Cytosine-specific methyltransferase n=1 Tax=Streptococcus suis TaxID=1307 RepID=A0A116MC31_STRSU|nr:DNA cytosine methyltransferase [Streptococcus suis]NQG42619.1 DNA cytosine methyltransferase [Streptococcus suis]NQG72690.1 DNA cytosine methyltransferase [Streptococcus suis]NQQ50799.1 DNA cytosine methyltransferase [Streptococcus suis]CYV39392.1 prophage LambdaSa2%2C type II DNA modification methyltransferase [Streptococcus suis]CYV78802.1 prophage LambdaSa2%2C type II DNA modification methyltransferase [Streptococcus suis]